MVPRQRRPFTPETTFDRVVAMAVERRKLGDLLLDQTDGWTAHALARVLHVVEQTPVATALRAIEPLRSTFLHALVAGMSRKAPTGSA
jgi:hypothetical protein